jgi:hypothetical protein
MGELQAERGSAWGLIRIGNASSVRAYDDSGTCFSFVSASNDEWRYALDVETRRPDDCSYVSSALEPSGLSMWVEVEVLAKLICEPAHLVMRQVLVGDQEKIRGVHGIEILRMDTASHWIAVGRRLRSADDTVFA